MQPTPPVEEKIADLTVRIKDAVIAKLKDRNATIIVKNHEHDWHQTIPKLAMGLECLASSGHRFLTREVRIAPSRCLLRD
jgi:hypothetical protein